MEQTVSPSVSPVLTTASPDGTANRWGPLAVVPPQGGSDLIGLEGTLSITEACVYVEASGKMFLLIWPADQTTWNAEARSVTFENFDRSVVTVRNGDRVVLGGSGDDEAESGITPQVFLARTTWVSRPGSSCSLDPRWHVGVVGN